ncbi:hypothetical protein JDV09_03220 [Mycobacterium sp. Y57]|uniref:hypothetical protein n=1 Tax=Mycolicibacterium xanthum TaxID=2796469 RepID=UPI001C84CC91|nr:hypothetical protein [Mycolicibacterium xanthum]MBX7431125.1 hypothetical protein [Mycolicibacterium xanthum]
MAQLVETRSDSAFNRRTRSLRLAGVELPPECAELTARLEAFETASTGRSCLKALTDAIATGDTDTAALFALALGEASPARNDVLEAVRVDISQRIRTVYSKHAPDIYAAVSKNFNAAAQAFIKAANTFDPEASPQVAIEASAELQKAWKTSAAAAAELTALTPALLSAALLAGVTGSSENPHANRGSHHRDDIVEADLLLALTVDPGDIDRQQLWAAWDSDQLYSAAAAKAAQGFTVAVPAQRRCSRWSALREIGAVLRAADIAAFQPYGRTEPAPPSNDPLQVQVG